MHGITVDADLYDDKGNLIARVDENQIHVLTGENVQMSRAGSLNSLIVTDGAGKQLLNFRYLNFSAIEVTGEFGCPGHALVSLTEHGIYGRQDNVCLENPFPNVPFAHIK
jgi:hypothetical protein